MGKSNALRWVKTLFFLISMTASLLLVCAPPLLVAILDFVLPSALLSAASDPVFSPFFVFSQLRSFDFGTTLVDLPLVSSARSLLILCVYSVWEGKGPYLGITMASNLVSFAYVLFKAVAFYGTASMEITGSKEERLIEALFLSSLALAMAHVVVAYRTNCRERRKLLVYRIDIEAVQVPSYKESIPTAHIHLEIQMEVTELKMNPQPPNCENIHSGTSWYTIREIDARSINLHARCPPNHNYKISAFNQQP
ncbi:hypothetical protein J5N97_021799 [Dioscorea zingiberensis]|uniref:MENTAL domain-containing protein n=1 Tax=Dioscorea zingiberensis TaxID=325984 RepID=A0A9D5CA92_9LILI|nr:hypothetical protein J5N97_021799 [Dioscorea zingiberensis]